MPGIFLSYAREDEPRARLLATALEARGWSVWWDRRIPHGKDFNAYIQQHLDAALCIVVLWSKASLASQFVRDEATEGLNGRLVPALIEAVKQPLGFRQLQAADLSDWHGQPGHAEFDRLVGSIGAILASPAASPATPPVQPGPLPPDAGVAGDSLRTVTQRILVGAAVFALALVGATVLGFLNSVPFNVMLERTDVAAESAFDWLIWGLRSLIGPLMNALQVVIAIVLLIVVVRLIRFLWSPADRFAVHIGRVLARARTRLRLDDPGGFAQLVFVIGVLYLGTVVWAHHALVAAFVGSLSTLTPEQRAILSPSNESQHLLYRSMLDYLVIGTGWSLYRLIRMRRAGSGSDSPLHVGAVVAVFAMATILWDAPYRLLFQSERPRVLFEGGRCYDLGSNARDFVIYCPEQPTKVRRVPLEQRPTSGEVVSESVFAGR